MAATLNLDPTMVLNFCSQDLEDVRNSLELISLKISHRPDAFTHPSLASILPFLESIRPQDSPTWHLTRARLLRDYESAWFLHTPGTDKQLKLLSGVECFKSESDEMANEKSYLLLLIPRFWNLENHWARLFTCAGLVVNQGFGPIISKKEFEQLDS
ncbi:hypothetical protein BP00DRAFT_223295 [Aspergillus indologenus CBS 114.80]|uniref:Uncharacterized protein n=1 Tax=Aspergillus indologenus CBS 114.80 TaxID=1450541 RepID=A0A2V5HZB9_9EURO|nr:hypothetical protein BP00DRAFT_223295 [Aspergillus indologenus CBS 114.80]